MKQLIQSYKTGEIRLVELPIPKVKKGCILVKTRASLVSIGTEKYMLEMARKSLIGKALARPDLVKQVIAKIRTEGFMEAYRQAMGRLDTPVSLGYSASGMVVDVGKDVDDFSVGDRVTITGSGYAGHAEYNLTPKLLAVKISDNVSFEEAAFGALGGIALEAVRMAKVQLGDWVAVIGLGLIGQIAVQLLNSAGCHVIGMDVSKERLEMALSHGLELGAATSDELILAVRERTKNQGVDSVIILAASKTSEPLDVASEIARERSVIVAAGLIPLDIPRKSFYEKELELVVSRAWGPGLYDEVYAEEGKDYPLAYARWTAQRNVAEFMDQVAKGRVSVKHLISHKFPFEDSLRAYEMILKGKEPFLGVVLEYPGADTREKWDTLISLRNERDESIKGAIGIGFIGAGLFAQGTLLPALKKIKKADIIDLIAVATSTGLRARHVAEKYSFSYFASDNKEILNDKRIKAVFILTRHGSHSALVCEALRAEKHVYVEKPLAVNENQLKELVDLLNELSRTRDNIPILMVGFNRRFAPTIRWLKEKFAFVGEPLAIHMTVNAGYVPPDSWVHDPEDGGGRIVGEVCHFIDLAQYLTGSLPKEVFAQSLSSDGYKLSDNVNISLSMENGSIVSISYLASGDKLFPRERVEVFGGGAVGVVDNFKRAVFYRRGKKESFRCMGVDRGYKAEVQAFFRGIREAKQPVELKEYIATTLTTFAIEEAVRKGNIISMDKKWAELTRKS